MKPVLTLEDENVRTKLVYLLICMLKASKELVHHYTEMNILLFAFELASNEDNVMKLIVESTVLPQHIVLACEKEPELLVFL